MKRQGISIYLMLVLALFIYPINEAAAGPGNPFEQLEDQVLAVQNSVNSLQADVDSVQSSVDGLTTKVDAIDAKLDSMKHGLKIQTNIDTATCASAPVQCANHSYVAADSSNHNPIMMMVQVIDNTGSPVNGLSLSNFSFSNPFVPAGGGIAVFCSESDCGVFRFLSGSNGLYAIFLDRGPVGNWKAGTHTGTVVITTDTGDTGTSMATFVIN